MNWADYIDKPVRDDLAYLTRLMANGWTPVFSKNDIKYGRTTADNVPHDAIMFTRADGKLECGAYNGYHWRLESVSGYSYRADSLAELIEKEKLI